MATSFYIMVVSSCLYFLRATWARVTFMFSPSSRQGFAETKLDSTANGSGIGTEPTAEDTLDNPRYVEEI